MRRTRRPIVIASRRSPLAQAQAQTIGQMLALVNAGLEVQYRWIESEGDRLVDASLADAGGKGLFARAVEQAVLNGRADVAVHSLKDLPTDEVTKGLVIAAVPAREDARDCLISRHQGGIDGLPQGGVVGTASPRRAAQLKRVRPDLQIQLIRGNIETRLRKVLEDGLYDATLLAVAGLRRAGLGQHATRAIDPSVVLPAAGQGALAVQCRAADHTTLTRCLPLNDAWTAAAVHGERRIVASLQGDCHSAIAALVEPIGSNGDGGVRVRGKVLSQDGVTCIENDTQVLFKQIDKATNGAASDLITRGAQAVLAGR